MRLGAMEATAPAGADVQQGANRNPQEDEMFQWDAAALLRRLDPATRIILFQGEERSGSRRNAAAKAPNSCRPDVRNAPESPPTGPHL